jgi:hypothetical protein
MRRYEITTALEDLCDANRADEIVAIGAGLYQTLADAALRGATTMVRSWEISRATPPAI